MDQKLEIELLREALTIDDLTGLYTRRAYDFADNLPVHVSIDHVGLHDINEKYGRGIGDWILCRTADVISQHNSHVYRMFSDRYVFQVLSFDAAQMTVNKIKQDLSDVNDELKTDENEHYIVSGIQLYYGIGHSLNAAYESSNRDKQAWKMQSKK
ncbi:MAG: hypothetical protein COA54_03740 [Thiotrichaceae bacterium]|nr:MAG: hypothetical protein COA54_03740 [Thiotrichaceae bacterium]